MAEFQFSTLCLKSQAAARERQDQLTKPRGSLGVLERIPTQLAALQGTVYPTSRPAAALLFAADHPVCRHGVSAYPVEVTAAMVRNFAAGRAAASVAAHHLGVVLDIVDVGVADPQAAHDAAALGRLRVVRDPVADDVEGDIRVQDAMSEATFERAVAAGRAAIDRLAPETRVVLLGEMGIGNTTLASAVTAALLNARVADVVDRGTGIDDFVRANKRAVVADAIARVPSDASPRDVLRRLGGRELAALYGAAGRACERGMLVLVDGFIVSSAILALVRQHPSAMPFMCFAHASREAGHSRILEALVVSPLLQLSMALGEASGALAAFPLIELACELHAKMATFAEASVPDKG